MKSCIRSWDREGVINMNSKGHFIVSISKSIIRVVGCALGMAVSSIPIVCISLIAAEVFGILEEVVDKR